MLRLTMGSVAVDRVEDVVRRAEEHRARALRVRGYVERQVRDELDRASRALRDEVAEPGLDHLEAIVGIARELRAADEQDLQTRDAARVEIHRALGRLRRCDSSAQLLRRVPVELTRACGFARAMISRVHHSEWIPILPPPGLDSDTDNFRNAFGDQPKLPLAHMLLEAEMVRRRIGIRVEDAATDHRVHEAFVAVAGAHGYVGAPIMPSGRVIGFLHADRIGQGHATTDEDLENIVLFAEHLGLLYERAAVAEELERRAVEVRSIQSALVRSIDALIGAELQLQPQAPVDPSTADGEADGDLAPPGRIALLSPREREVLDLIVAGETNGAIARELVLGEQTVKSHVSHILRKLRATSRAEAAARYLRISNRSP
jgi:DNA-binding CsgD family transcriptional regulator